jgi:hypothetical protein
MKPIELIRQKLAEMLEKYPQDSELSVELQTLYTLSEGVVIKANDIIGDPLPPDPTHPPKP